MKIGSGSIMSPCLHDTNMIKLGQHCKVSYLSTVLSLQTKTLQFSKSYSDSSSSPSLAVSTPNTFYHTAVRLPASKSGSWPLVYRFRWALVNKLVPAISLLCTGAVEISSLWLQLRLHVHVHRSLWTVPWNVMNKLGWCKNWVRGVQDVHCVMHKCIMVTLGGNEKHKKYVKTRKFYEIRGRNLKK